MSSNIAKRKSKSVKKLHHHHRMKTKRKKKRKEKILKRIGLQVMKMIMKMTGKIYISR